ncbi:MAG: hypothetical protein J0G94_03475 [Sphingomonadales bacterium]|nr:hypothetical protein [Sphingomonadales bacterium]
MQVAARRLIVISAISLFGATVGIVLGNFAAGGTGPKGGEELAEYSAFLAIAGNASRSDEEDRADFAARSGPTSYHCEGCDAALYNDMTAAPLAEVEPLPAYQAQDAPVPPEGAAVLAPRGGAAVTGSASAPARKIPAVKAESGRPLPPLPPADGAKRPDRLSAPAITGIEAIPATR